MRFFNDKWIKTCVAESDEDETRELFVRKSSLSMVDKQFMEKLEVAVICDSLLLH